MRELIDITQQQTHNIQQILRNFKLDKEEVQIDQRLADWIKGLGLHESAQRIFLAEGYTLEDVLYNISEDDLRRIGLRGGTQLRIWRAIMQHRKEIPSLCNGDIDQIGTI